MQDEPRYFTVTQAMDAYANASRGGAFQLVPAQVYAATQVCKSHVVLDHPQHPGQPLYLPLKSPWWWARVQFAPQELNLSGLFS